MTAAVRLTPIEASFIRLERTGFPMHVAAVVVLDGGHPITMPQLRQHVAKRLRPERRFHERVRTLSAGRGAEWVSVKGMHYSAHLFHHELPSPGTRAQLNEACAQIHEEELDRDRPLWEIHLLDGLAGGRQALVIKTHHAITDGLAGIELAEVLFDPAPDTSSPGLPAMNFVERQGSSVFTALQGLVGVGFAAASGPLVLDGPFNGPVGPHRTFGTATISMDEVRRVKRAVGGSIDDVVVATVAAGLSDYLRDVGYPVIPPALKAMLPVSTRTLVPGAHFGNHVSAVFVDLPTDTPDFAAVVRHVAASKATLRTAHAAFGSAMLVAAAGHLPQPLHTALLRAVSELPFANLVLSDVPGPDEPLYLFGRRIVACHPMMPLAPRVGLAIAAVSLGGTMGLGVTADPGLVPDPQRLATAIARALPRSSSSDAGRTGIAGLSPNRKRMTPHRRTPTS